MSKPSKKSSLVDQLVVVGVFVVLGLAALAWFVHFAEPDERQPRQVFVADYDEAPMAEVMDEQGFEKRLAEIAAAGTASGERTVGRRSGSPGFYRTEKLILDTYREAGLEVVTQEFPVVVPITEQCEVLDAEGKPLEDVQIFPFDPNGFLPMALPEEGISGELVAAESCGPGGLDGRAADQSIVLTYISGAGSWANLAAAGVKAVLVKEETEAVRRATIQGPERQEHWAGIAWVDLSAAVLGGTYPRFLVRGPIEKYADQKITLRCKVSWQTRHVRNLLGVLRADQPREEALVITCSYDSYSWVPDLAPGAEQSISLSAMLEYVRGLARYDGSLKRDVIFVATAGSAQAKMGDYRLLEAIETYSHERSDFRTFEERQAHEQEQIAFAEKALSLIDAPGTNAAARAAWTKDRLAAEPPAFREWITERVKTVAGEVCLARSENALQAKLAHLRVGGPAYRDGFDAVSATDKERQAKANEHPLLTTYIAAKTLENRAANMMGLPLNQLVAREEYGAWGYAERLRAYLAEITTYHQQQRQELDDMIAVRDLFARYERTLTIVIDLYSGGHSKQSDLAILLGIPQVGSIVEPQVTDLANAIMEKVPEEADAPAFEVINWGPKDRAGSGRKPCRADASKSVLWYPVGRLAFSVVNRAYQVDGNTRVFSPEDTVANMSQTDVLKGHIPAVGKALLSVAQGRVTFKGLAKATARRRVHSIGGTVYASVGTAEMIPSHRMARRTFVRAVEQKQGQARMNGADNLFTWKGRGLPILAVNPYGEFRLERISGANPHPFTADAVRFGADGRITFIKDGSEKSRAVFKNLQIESLKLAAEGLNEPRPLNVALFRCAPVLMLEQGNPSTLSDFNEFKILNATGLSPFNESYHASGIEYVSPDAVFYVSMLAGEGGNESLIVPRAFALNADPEEPIAPDESQLFGKGYLAADTPIFVLPHMEAAESMLRTAEKRLALQRKFGMADKQMLDFHERGRDWLDDAKARQAANDLEGMLSSAASSLAYAINNHPVIEQRISHAVVGILWYLGLLVPFVFFCEKLVFGFPDIRKQLFAVGAIFLVVFSLLRFFHPAFQMVRSSLMILLGFIMLLLTGLVTLMVAGKFKQNIKSLRASEGKVEGADINRGGVAGTAFMLGLNNMRRRKVRTALTCATLVLITFVMICFTSVSTDLDNKEHATGRSSWNGLMVRNSDFQALSDSRLSTIRRLFSGRYPVTVHKWMGPSLSVYEGRTEGVKNIDVLVEHERDAFETRTVKQAHLSGLVQMEWNEPLFSGIDKLLLTERGWFERPPQSRAEKLAAAEAGLKLSKEIILPERVATELGITVESVNSGTMAITINGEELTVRGIIDSAALDKVRGLDGHSIMPYDINSLSVISTKRKDHVNDMVMVPQDVKRLSAADVALVSAMPPVSAATDGSAAQSVGAMSCSVLFPSAPYLLSPADPDRPERPAVGYKQQRRVVMEYLERTGQESFYALDGVSYAGSRKRSKSLGGMIELLIPIIIAALAVFNTMRGSVYERRSEIYVYNAVGIAPNHVFFMFMAEALVYAVMGAMLGYLLSQATGRVLTVLGMTGGLNMDYSSIETIYASLAIMGAVLLSSILPARDAARMAAPSEITSWTVPSIDGDVMTLNLPFTFTAHDRVAVVSYFMRWLESHGEGSSGGFFCSPPEPYARVADTEPEDAPLMPGVSSQVWLKPYDLGVSQRMDISLPTDAETSEYIAHIELTLLSGHAKAWERTVRPFLGTLRKQFLNWRATTDDQRAEMFAEAKKIIARR